MKLEKLIAETEAHYMKNNVRYRRRIRHLLDTVFADQDGSDCDINWLVTMTYVIARMDAKRKKRNG